LKSDKVFQIAAASDRVYGISEYGTLELAYLEDDHLVQDLAPAKKKDDDEDDSLDEDNVKEKKTKFLNKIVKIEDIRADEAMDQADANNASIIAGSDAEDEDDEEYGEASIKEQSTLKSALKASEKTRNIS
jgi:hypothetical protein